MNYQAKPVYSGGAAHGESAWWDSRKGLAMYMDCGGTRLFCYDPKTQSKKEVALTFHPMAVIGCAEAGYVAASEDSVLLLDDDFRVTREILKFKHKKATNRFNDCKCGPDGAFYLGVMGTQDEPDEGGLFRLDPSGEITAVIGDAGISNGFAWSADTKTLFYTDTIHHEIYAYDFANGAVSNRRVVFRDEALLPDGMCIDAEDHLWVALWGEGCVICVDPASGKVLHRVSVDSPLSSSVVFGGESLDTLFITSSRLGLSKEEIEQYPNSGALYSVQVNVRGAELYRGRFQ